ncbi:disulfide bond formation protein B [Sphingomonas astaxanthinifaciens]|uniref:Dihydroneopterin aldolase n=1 Tax=Sphingomonas astaxanthinifaciens DSM 22298 TaxID=1123267 RepID=A0ABQ5Z7J5_9SPHN|nr:disulfide bond formation protein B [Sphingomonas astaxanthinifaciens]GLR48775.1 dihydroneopterin aldolase [Sphingomonas astaxanthinifaciens DSM 22298]
MDARTTSLAAVSGGRLRLAQWLALAVPGALLLGALGSQVIGGLVPCEMCMWQRWPHLAAIVLAGLSLALPRQARLLTVLAVIAIAVSGAIGVFHAGVEAGWWQGLTACSTTAAGATPDELLKSILATPLVRCDQVQWSFAGLSLAAWNAIISLLSVGVITWLMAKR